MKKLRLLFCLLVVVCIITSSSTTFSAMPKGKFPIRILPTVDNPNQYERELLRHLEKTFNNSPNFKVTKEEEDRIILLFIVDRHIPGVVSTDVLASANPINTYSLVWLAKPKDKHAYYLWHDAGTFSRYEDLSQYILKETNITVTKIKNYYSYLFE